MPTNLARTTIEHHSNIETQTPIPIRPNPPSIPSLELAMNHPRIGIRRRRRLPGYVPRPQNPFILFRKDAVEKLKALREEEESYNTMDTGPRRRQADISKEVSRQWKALTPQEKAEWKKKADQLKVEHKSEHPDYHYQPNRM